jgi:hypothetical protein
MGYRVRYVRAAKKELDDCCRTYGEPLCGDIKRWLRRLANKAEARDDSESQDLLEALKETISDDTVKHFWHRWREASVVEKLKSLVITITNYKAAWRLRHSAKHFRFAGDACTCEVDVFYEIDDVNGCIVVRKFLGLPGQGSEDG